MLFRPSSVSRVGFSDVVILPDVLGGGLLIFVDGFAWSVVWILVGWTTFNRV